jgi:mRNA interferase RelE/StbE
LNTPPLSVRPSKSSTPRTRLRLKAFLEDRIANLNDPRSTGKALTGPLGGLWRYRMGDYRIICDIQDRKLVVLVIAFSHRSDAYR